MHSTVTKTFTNELATYLTHLCRIHFPIGRTRLFQILGVLGVFFIFIQILIEYCVSKQPGDLDQTFCGVWSEFSISHKKDARLIWVNRQNAYDRPGVRFLHYTEPVQNSENLVCCTLHTVVCL